MDIPLCRMRSLQVVRPVLQNDILKLHADFVHGYRAGAAVFYVSLTDEQGRGIEVTAKDRENWDKFHLFSMLAVVASPRSRSNFCTLDSICRRCLYSMRRRSLMTMAIYAIQSSRSPMYLIRGHIIRSGLVVTL
jgi:hypothetical protein